MLGVPLSQVRLMAKQVITLSQHCSLLHQKIKEGKTLILDFEGKPRTLYAQWLSCVQKLTEILDVVNSTIAIIHYCIALFTKPIWYGPKSSVPTSVHLAPIFLAFSYVEKLFIVQSLF